jgi:hypothetical protein
MGDLTYCEPTIFLLQNGFLEYVGVFLSSLSVGLIATIVSNPFDVVKSRVMGQPINVDGTCSIIVELCIVCSLHAAWFVGSGGGFAMTEELPSPALPHMQDRRSCTAGWSTAS